jgi:hypothetical protein
MRFEMTLDYDRRERNMQLLFFVNSKKSTIEANRCYTLNIHFYQHSFPLRKHWSKMGQEIKHTVTSRKDVFPLDI